LRQNAPNRNANGRWDNKWTTNITMENN
jgi:hypothetical protein